MARGDRIGWMPLFSFSIFPWGWGWALVDLVFIRRTRGRWCGLDWFGLRWRWSVSVGGSWIPTFGYIPFHIWRWSALCWSLLISLPTSTKYDLQYMYSICMTS